MSTFCECTCCHHDYTHTALLQPDLATGHTAYAAKLMAPLSIGRLQSSDASGDVKIEIGTGESTTTCPGGGDTSTSTNCPFSGAGPQSPPVNENIWLRDSKDGVNIGDGPDDVDPSTFNALAAIHFIGISYTFGKLLGPLSVAEQWRAKVGGVEGIMERETLRANRSQILVYAMLFIVVCRLDVLGLVPLTAAELVCAAAVATAIYGALILCAVLLSSFRVADADNDLKRLIANAAKPRLHASAFLVLLYMLLLVAVQAGGFGLWVHGHAAALGVLALVYAPDTLGGVQAGGAPRTSTRTFASTLSSLGLGLGPLTAACFGLISPPQLATALGFGVATVLLFGTLKPSLRGWGRDAMQCMMVSAGCQAALFMWVLFPVLGMPLLAYFGSDGSEWALPTAKLWGDWATCVRTVVMSHLTFVLTLPCVLELCDSQCSVAGIHVHSLIPAYLSLFFRVPWLVLSLDITRVASLLTAVAGIVPVWTYQSSKLSNSVRMLCREQVDAKHLAFEVGFCAFVTFFRNFVANSIFLTFVRPLLKFVNTIQADFLVYYAHPYPILNFDKISSNNIDVGIAFLVTPQDDQLQPTVTCPTIFPLRKAYRSAGSMCNVC